METLLFEWTLWYRFKKYWWIWLWFSIIKYSLSFLLLHSDWRSTMKIRLFPCFLTISPYYFSSLLLLIISTFFFSLELIFLYLSGSFVLLVLLIFELLQRKYWNNFQEQNSEWSNQANNFLKSLDVIKNNVSEFSERKTSVLRADNNE